MIANFIIIYFTVGSLLALFISTALWAMQQTNLTNGELLATIVFWPVVLRSYYKKTK